MASAIQQCPGQRLVHCLGLRQLAPGAFATPSCFRSTPPCFMLSLVDSVHPVWSLTLLRASTLCLSAWSFSKVAFCDPLASSLNSLHVNLCFASPTSTLNLQAKASAQAPAMLQSPALAMEVGGTLVEQRLRVASCQSRSHSPRRFTLLAGYFLPALTQQRLPRERENTSASTGIGFKSWN